MLLVFDLMVYVSTPWQRQGVKQPWPERWAAVLFVLARRRLAWEILAQILVDSARTTAMLFTLFIAFSQLSLWLTLLMR